VTGQANIVNEFFVPEPDTTISDYLERGSTTAVHHLIRYEWAQAVLAEARPPSRILDVACGSGYGSNALACRFPDAEVVGADYDETAVSSAESLYEALNLRFVRANVMEWPETLGDFDYIVSFDTIEHVPHRELMLENVVEHLDAEGSLLLSTPVYDENHLVPEWEHHRVEYSATSLYDFLRRYFEEILAPDFATLPCAHVFDEINRETVVYLLRMNPVVCRKPVRIHWPSLRAAAKRPLDHGD
jgi:SAM-dependent methyltransferase